MCTLTSTVGIVLFSQTFLRCAETATVRARVWTVRYTTQSKKIKDNGGEILEVRANAHYRYTHPAPEC